MERELPRKRSRTRKTNSGLYVYNDERKWTGEGRAAQTYTHCQNLECRKPLTDTEQKRLLKYCSKDCAPFSKLDGREPEQ